MSDKTQEFLLFSVELMAALFILVLGLIVIAIIIVYIFDVTQTKSAIKRNYPVVGHFRYFFEHIGEFFRQYFFAMDREEILSLLIIHPRGTDMLSCIE